jgi:preprotein translocase subunit YajC
MTSLWQSLSGMALLAQDAAPPAGDPSSIFGGMLPMILMMMVVFFFVVLRPQQREQRAREALLKAIKKNDRVLTNGGIFGVVTNVNTEAGEVTIRVDEKNDTKLRITLASIARVLGDETTSEKSEKTEKS